MKRRFFALLAVPALALGFALASPDTDEAQAQTIFIHLLPYIEQDNIFAMNFGLGDGSVRFIRDSTQSLQTWQTEGSRSGGETLSLD
jgi:hypothetical protein